MCAEGLVETVPAPPAHPLPPPARAPLPDPFATTPAEPAGPAAPSPPVAFREGAADPDPYPPVPEWEPGDVPVAAPGAEGLPRREPGASGIREALDASRPQSGWKGFLRPRGRSRTDSP